MTANRELMYWHSNKNWFRRIEEIPYFELTDEAPERALKSFEMWKKDNGIEVENEKS